VGLLKWLHENSVNADFGWVQNYTPKEEIFPSYVPADAWQFLYAGSHLDGFLQTRSGEDRPAWQVADGTVSVSTANSASERFYFEHWGLDYDVAFLIQAQRGRASFLICMDADGTPAFLPLPLPAQQWVPMRVKFMKGTWTLFIDGKESKSGRVPVPQEATSAPEVFGFLAESDSAIEISSIRYRQPY